MGFTNSPLADTNSKYRATSNNYTEGRNVNGKNYDIDTITLHCVVGHPNKAGLASCFQGSRQCSCNYGIVDNGDIILVVEEKNRSWCSSNRYNDVRAITVEINSDTYEPYAMTDEAVDSAIDLCVDICERNGINKMYWFSDKDEALDKQKNHQPREGVFTVHRWFANKSCPGDFLFNRMGWLCDEVNKRLSGVTPGPSPEPGKRYTVCTNGSALRIRQEPNTDSAQIGWVDNETSFYSDKVVEGEWIGGIDTWVAYKGGYVSGKYIVPTPEVTPEPTPEPTPTPTGPYWRVQCGAFRIKDNAIALEKQLNAKGYDTYMILANDGLYKVQLGAFNDRQNAEKLSVKLSFDGFDTYIVRY